MILEDIMKDNQLYASGGFSAVFNKKAPEEQIRSIEALIKMIISFGRAKAAGINLLPLLREFVDRKISGALAGAKEEDKPACKKGCAACCYQLVSCSKEEAENLKYEVIDGFQLEHLRKQAKWVFNNNESDRQKYSDDLGKEGARCVFLMDDGACGVYEKRPLSCRLVMVKNASACDIFTNKGEMKKQITVNDAELAVTAFMNVEDHKTMQQQIAGML